MLIAGVVPVPWTQCMLRLECIVYIMNQIDSPNHLDLIYAFLYGKSFCFLGILQITTSLS